MKDLVAAYSVLLAELRRRIRLRNAKVACYLRGHHIYNAPICDLDSASKQFTYRLICKDCGHEEIFYIPED